MTITYITPCMVQNAIDTLKCGKSNGNDGLSAEHSKHADRHINTLLSIFYTSVITHGYENDYYSLAQNQIW